MKCISMMLTSNCSESCNRNVLSKEKSGLQKAQSEEFCNGKSYMMPIHKRFYSGQIRERKFVTVAWNEVYFYNINLKLLGIV